VPFMFIYAGKYRTEDILKMQTIQKLNTTQKTSNTKHSKTKLASFDFSRLLRHSARKRGGLVLQRSRAHTALKFIPVPLLNKPHATTEE